MVQWLRICFLIQETQVWSLVWEDSTCHRATKPPCCNYWTHALEPMSRNYQAHMPLLKPAHPTACALQQEKPPQWEARAPKLETSPGLSQLEKGCVQQQRPSVAKKNSKKFISVIYLLVITVQRRKNIWSLSIDTEKTCDKIQHPSMIKNSQQTRNRKKLTQADKGIYKKHRVNITRNHEKLDTLSYGQEQGNDVHCHQSYLTSYWKS